MKEGFDTTHCFMVEGKLALPYSYFAGRVGSKFLTTIRDEQKILGIRCSKCKKVFVPPRQTCPPLGEVSSTVGLKFTKNASSPVPLVSW